MFNLGFVRPSSSKEGVLSLFWRVVVRPNIWQALMISTLMLVGAILEMITVGLAVPLLDTVTNPNQVDTSRVAVLIKDLLSLINIPTSNNILIFTLLAIASILFLTRSGLLLLHQYLTAKVAQYLRRQVKGSLFERFLQARYENLSQRGRGSIHYDLNKPPSNSH